jgi:PhnB protein
MVSYYPNGGNTMQAPTLFACPYINFQGQAREAMQFYQKVLGGKLDLLAVDDKGQTHPAGPEESIMHARLLSDYAVIMATDGSPDYPASKGENFAVALVGSDNPKMTQMYNELAEGGKAKMPLSDSSWGDKFGYLEDKFGINWMLDITSPDNMKFE